MRAAGGEVKLGRFISPVAYQAYARGAVAEAEGRLGEAEVEYERAADSDLDGPEPAVALGRVLCQEKRVEEARAAFDRADAADSDSSLLARERARCALANGEVPEALEQSALAMRLDPADDETLVLRADALARANQPREAVLLLVARVLEGPSPEALRLRLLSVAEASNDVAAARIARAAAPRVPVHTPAQNADTPVPTARKDVPVADAKDRKPTLAELDEAITSDDRRAAKHLALRVGLSTSDLALRAALLGRTALAKELAKLVADADPSDTSAWIALALAADLTGDAAAFEDAVRRAPAHPTRLTSLAELALVELLARRAGLDAARALGANLDAPRADAVEDVLRKRVQSRLAAKPRR